MREPNYARDVLGLRVTECYVDEVNFITEKDLLIVMKLLKSKKQTPSRQILHAAKVVAGVDALIACTAIKIMDNVVYLHKELWYSEKHAMSWMKNLYMYCKLAKTTERDRLYFKNIETEEIMGYYHDETAVVMVEVKEPV